MTEYERKIWNERVEEINSISELAKGYLRKELPPEGYSANLINLMLLVKLVDISKDLHKMEGCFDLLTTKEREWYS